MTQDEIIEMARQVGVVPIGFNKTTMQKEYSIFFNELEAFAKLVAEKVAERYMQLFLDSENQPTQFGTATQEYREQEIREEREACAKVCEEYETNNDIADTWLNIVSEVIRARGQA